MLPNFVGCRGKFNHQYFEHPHMEKRAQNFPQHPQYDGYVGYGTHVIPTQHESFYLKF